MKNKILLFIASLIISTNMFAQMGGPNDGLSGNLIVFSEDGQKFYLILNGIRQNDLPETNVKVTNLTAPYYSAKIIFEDKNIPMIEKKMLYIQDDRGQPYETNYHIINTKDGSRALRMFVQVAMVLAPPTEPGVKEIKYTTVAKAPITYSTTTTTTTTTVNDGTTNSNINTNGNVGANVNVNVDGVGLGMNVNINDPYLNSNATTTTTYSTTTTTTSTNTNTNGGVITEQPYMSGYTGPTGCNGWPMKDADFNSAKASISSKSFEESKLTTAKQVANSNCLTASQVKQIMDLFSFEDSRLDFAKHAYAHTFDVGNYFKVNDAFKFESSIDDLNSFIGK